MDITPTYILKKILKRIRAILALGLIAMVVLIFAVLNMPNYYKSTTTLLPIMDSSPSFSKGLAASVFSKFGGAGGIIPDLPSGDSQKILTILESHSLAEKVLQELKSPLLSNLFPDDWDSKKNKWREEPVHQELILKAFLGSLKFTSSLDRGTILLEAEFTDAQLAKQVLDTYLKLLRTSLQENTLTLAKRNLLFLEDQLEKNIANLLSDGTKAMEVDSAKGSIDGTALYVVYDPEDQVFKQSDKTNPNAIATKPESFFDYLSGRKKILEQSNLILEQQYLSAKVDANQKDLSFFVIDPPKAPFMKSRPIRTTLVVVGFFVVGFLLCFLATLVGILEDNKSTIKELFSKEPK